ncbi:hypothetical protein N7465_011312 [Penicillium sp. CMV-2018d]|nr:hypothetical protein N7465_011312 [Penicillium sp. CMV-2018d]
MKADGDGDEIEQAKGQRGGASHWKLISLSREDELFDSAGEVKWKPKYVRLTYDAAIVSLFIHDKAYRATYLPWGFDSKEKSGRSACLSPTILITQNGLWSQHYKPLARSLPTDPRQQAESSGHAYAHSSRVFFEGNMHSELPTYMNTILSNNANNKDGAEIRDALRFAQRLAAFRAALENHQSQDPTITIFWRLPLYHGPGPLIKIRIRDTCEYEISKALLCAESPVFTAMFEGSFLEAQEQAVDLELMEDVISKRSLEALFQWLYLRIVKFNNEDHGEHIS